MSLTKVSYSMINGAILNIADYGAHSTSEPGYSTFNSTTAIQSAIDVAGVGGSVYIPKGTYLIDGLTVNTNFITIVGVGLGSVLQTTATSNIGIHIASTVPVEGSVLKDFALVGTSTNAGGISLGTASLYAAFTLLDQVLVSYFDKPSTGYGVLFNSVQELEIRNCKIQYNYINVYRDSSSGFVTSAKICGKQGYIGRALDKGVCINGIFADLTIKDVVIEENVNEGIYVGAFYGQLILDCCYFENNSTGGIGTISLVGSTASYSSIKTTISNCTFHSNALITKPNLYLDNVIGAIISGNDGIFSNGGIITTIHSAAYFCMNKTNDASDPFTLYNALLGQISYFDYDQNLFPQLYCRTGIIVKTPDGSKQYQISVDNAGAVTSTLL